MTSPHPIVVTLDFSDSNSAVIQHAWELAEARDCEVHFLHVIPRSLLSQDSVPPAYAETLQHLQRLTGLPRGMGHHQTRFSHQIRYGSPAREIVDYATECAAATIIMGSRGRSRLSHMVLGSVTEAVLHNATCSVMIVPETPAADFRTEDSSQPSADMDATEQAVSGMTNEPPDSNRVIELLKRAMQWRATDVHIDQVGQDRTWIRFRVDGKLRTFCHLDQNLAAPLLMQLKLMADFDTTQCFVPQEGRLKLPADLGMVEVRVTIVPACEGDAVAMRILRHESLPRQLSTLGMSDFTRDNVHAMLHQREGLVLVTGPTGSGKTTTVYAMLQKLGYNDRNIVSIEDPVEYRVPGIRQLSVNSRHELTLARGLKTLLRMDPDVVFIGEIRDAESLEIAMRAASSGRYVFSTLHTRDVASTITALRDLHADSYSLAGNLTGIVSQRLIRCLCRHCRAAAPITVEEQDVFLAEGLEPPQELYQPRGCNMCLNIGYRERVGIFEAVTADDKIAAALQTGVPEDELRRVIRETGAKSLVYDALTKARDGITSLAEARALGWT